MSLFNSHLPPASLGILPILLVISAVRVPKSCSYASKSEDMLYLCFKRLKEGWTVLRYTLLLVSASYWRLRHFRWCHENLFTTPSCKWFRRGVNRASYCIIFNVELCFNYFKNDLDFNTITGVKQQVYLFIFIVTVGFSWTLIARGKVEVCVNDSFFIYKTIRSVIEDIKIHNAAVIMKDITHHPCLY